MMLLLLLLGGEIVVPQAITTGTVPTLPYLLPFSPTALSLAADKATSSTDTNILEY